MTLPTPAPVDPGTAPAFDVDVVVVGAGFAGLAMLRELRDERGLSVQVLEAGDDVGGVWYWNRYPGARCDVDSTDYSYSFSSELDEEWNWSERYATQPEILRYVHHVADKFDLRSDISLGARVVEASWDEDSSHWHVSCENGLTGRGRYLVMATGCLSATKRPELDGLGDFRGQVLHTADWPAEPVDLTDKRVGVIGTGSSGIQVIPTVAPVVDQLFVFQRTPTFSVPARHQVLTDADRAAIRAELPQRRELLRKSPTGLSVPITRQSALEVDDKERRAHYEEYWATAGFGFLLSYSDLLTNRESNDTAADFIRSKIAERVEDPELREKLTPRTYPYGAKRPCVDTGYYETFNRPNVTLVDIAESPLAKVTETSLHTSTAEYELDVIVFATGFDAMTGSLLRPEIRGRGGETLREHWQGGPLTYLGLATSGFPNMFIIAGPGSPSLLGNVMVSIEQHVDWVSDLLTRSLAEGTPTIEAQRDAEAEWVAHVNAAAAGTLYWEAASYYLGAEIPGKPRVFMPYAGGLRRYRRECDQVAQDGYAGFSRTP
ncbi:cyclohexanone monooxygenase [Blastococcus colisei]|uniref:Cyclohexanone monooxygenase n=1 Tax=Blastococcus colisei TaxID=1564162 RepID=A0A543PA77_9ACTN|nr:NAD(P)/FAD-dependent oxidoreductase [Blastococcus colisei]TQN40991.1 cyclohexanone monooxygenase [Blastococcus colisei]